MASKKDLTCDRVQRKVAGKTRDEIMDAICAEFDLPRPKTHAQRSRRSACKIKFSEGHHQKKVR